MLHHRLASAGIGFVVTLIPVMLLWIGQWLLARYIVAAIWGGFDPATDGWAVPSFRAEIDGLYHGVVLMLLAHWLLTALFGRGEIRRVPKADLALALSGIAFALTVLFASTTDVGAIQPPWACALLGASSELPDFGFDAVSPCQAQLRSLLPLLFWGVPTLLLVASLWLRIGLSRRAHA